MELDAPELALQATRTNTADNWHRRKRHINDTNLCLLNKTNSNGMHFVGGVSECDVRAIGESTPRAYPNKANLKVSNPFWLVYTDLTGPTSPRALRGVEYASKITDEYTNWPEVFLVQTKREAGDTIQLHVKPPVSPLRYRIVRLRADHGTEYTGSSFREKCCQTAMQLDLFASNTSTQIGVSKRIVRTLAKMARSMLLDIGLPKYV